MAEEETQALSGTLTNVTLASGAAFAALTAEVFLSVRALNVEAQAIDEVSNALQNQGIYTDNLAASYRRVAEEIEKKTGVDADAISSGQAVAQGLVGQIALTDQLTKAIVDFAANQKVELSSAFTIVGKAIQGNVGALQRYGITIDEGLTKQQRLQQITEVLGQKFEGSAEKAAKAKGSLALFTAEFGNAQKEIGRRFQPVFDAAVAGVTKFIRLFNENKALADFTVSLIAAGIAVSSIGLVVGTAGILFLKFKAALLAAQIATGAMTIATRALVGATGIGLLVIVVSELYLNWSTVWPRMQKIYQAFVNNVVDVAQGLGKILFAVFVPSTSSLSQIQEGAKQVGDAFRKGFATATEEIKLPDAPEDTQDPVKKKLADKQGAKEDAEEKRKLATRQASLELIKLQEQQASLELIDLKKQEVEILKQLEDEKNKDVRLALEARLEDTRILEAQQVENDKERRKVLNEDLLASNEAFQQMSQDQQADFLARNQQQLEQGLLTARLAKEQAVKDELEVQKKANNTFLLDQQKFGTAYAAINKIMHSTIYQGTKQAFGELAQLQESSNATLKSIGKVAAIANIVIRTAESAMNIYAGFSTIPIVGPALGVAGAAAAVAFGAEQLGKVKGAAQGGLMQGGIPGKDSIPVMAQDGELITPTKNFDEVIGSVRAAREAKQFEQKKNPADTQMQSEMLDSLKSIEEKLQQPTQTNVTFQGDVLADPTFIDVLVTKISEQLEFGNAKLFGVTA